MAVTVIVPKARSFDPDKDMAIFEDNSGWVADEKMKGDRLLVENGVCLSSLGNQMSVPWFEKLIKGAYFGLDGELYIPGGNEHDVHHLRATNPDKLRVCFWEAVRDEQGKDLRDNRWIDRRRVMDKILDDLEKADKRIRRTRIAFKDKMDFHKQLVKEKVEGTILKHIGGRWKAGSRTVWIKMKDPDDYDSVIVDVRLKPGCKMSDDEGLKILFYGFHDKKTGELVECGSLGVPGTASDIGKVAVIKAWDQYKKTGALQHPQFIRFRDDKLVTECVFGFKKKKK